uniref:Rab proteins geranylgeranyltransferase component A 1-like n=1 Tax=Saccoglossus kowalevskii TaxID=10224 RepID=A0ABM0MH96_SACKO
EAEEKEETKEVDLSNSEVEDGENLVHMPSQGKTISNIEVHSYIKEKNENPEVSEVEPCLAVEPEPCPIIPEDSEQVTMGESSVHFEFEASSEDTDEKHGEQDVAVETTSVNAAEEKSNEHESEQTKSNGQSKDFDSNSACAEQSDKTAPDVTDAESTPEPSAIKCEEVKEANTKTREFTLEDFKRDWRRFNIDIAPKMLFSRGSLVELLISSNISRYAEFKCVTSILTYLNDRIEQVPCSRSDVFSSKFVSMLEKRMLMKFIEFSLSYESHTEQYEEYLDKPFVEFLRTRKLTPNLQHFVQHSIAMVTDQTPTVEGLKATHHFLRSLGRYGNTPFLWPLYGSGELPQCFCRLEFYHSYDSNVSSVDVRNFYLQVMLLTIPPIQGKNPVRVIELNHCAYACPKGMYVVQMTCKGSGVAKDDLQFVVDMLFHQNSEGELRYGKTLIKVQIVDSYLVVARNKGR